MDVNVLDDIYRYWYGDPPEVPPGKERMERWFRPGADVDAHIRESWGGYLDEARAADWDLTRLTREQRVGLIILLDQFPRQVHRDAGESYAYDTKARQIAGEIVDDGAWRRYRVYEQLFLMLPFEHSEDVADQDLSVMYFAAHAVEAPEAARDGARRALDQATKHRDIIRQFGRFPHRNQMLGRKSTDEEIEFLKGGRGF